MSTESNQGAVKAQVSVNYRSGRAEYHGIWLNLTEEDMENEQPTLGELEEIVEASFEGGDEGFLTLDNDKGQRVVIRLREVESISVHGIRNT